MFLHGFEQSNIELIVSIFEFNSFDLRIVPVLLYALHLSLSYHFVALSPDVWSERSIIFEIKYHFFILLLFAGFAAVEPIHSRNYIFRVVLTASERSICCCCDVLPWMVSSPGGSLCSSAFEPSVFKLFKRCLMLFDATPASLGSFVF